MGSAPNVSLDLVVLTPQAGDIRLQGAGIDPSGGDGLAGYLADAAAMGMADPCWEDRQLPASSVDVVLLPVKFGAAIVDVIAIQNPGQNAGDRFGGVVFGAPIAVPGHEAFTRGVMLNVEQWVDEQTALRADLHQQRPFGQIPLEAPGDGAHDRVGHGVGLGIAVIDPDQGDVGRAFVGAAGIPAKTEARPLQVGAAVVEVADRVGKLAEPCIAIRGDQLHGRWWCSDLLRQPRGDTGRPR